MTTPLDEDTLALLAAYAEGELDGDEKDAMERRLAAEPELAAELAAMRSLQSSLKMIPRDEAPDDFARSVAQRIRRRSGGRFFRDDAHRPRLSIELVLAIAAVVFGLLAVVHSVETIEILTDTPIAPEGAPREGSGEGPSTPGPAPEAPGAREPAPEPTAAPEPGDGVGMPERGAVREGVVSGGRYAGAVRRERVYVIETELAAPDLEVALRQRAGRDVFARDERGFVLSGVEVEVPSLVERLTPLGRVRIETVDFAPGAEQTPARIVVIPSR